VSKCIGVGVQNRGLERIDEKDQTNKISATGKSAQLGFAFSTKFIALIDYKSFFLHLQLMVHVKEEN
jgi:hypothetical protein